MNWNKPEDINYKKLKFSKGFTLIELIIVISIISVLALIGVGSYRNIQTTSRDIKRKSDLKSVRLALQQYYAVYNTFRVSGSGANDGGTGWLSYENGTSYKKSVVHRLAELGYLNDKNIEDPKQNPGYMIYLCDGGQTFALFATLEVTDAKELDKAKNHTCNGVNVVNNYKKNYTVSNKYY